MKFEAVKYFLILLTFALFSYYGTIIVTSNRVESNSDAATTQIGRKKVMREYCLTHLYEKKLKPSDFRLMIVDDENKIIYCGIPKVSSTTWSRVLRDLRGLDKNIEKIHSKDLWRWLSQYTEEERSKRIKTYFKFLFVREPLHRLLSAYKDKFMRKNTGCSRLARKQIVKAYRPQDYKSNYNDINITFAEFIQYFSNDVPRNVHWRQYEKLCHPCVINYDFIGHLETLEDDAPLLLKMAGIDDRVSFPPIHKSTSTDEVLEYYSQVPSRYIKRLGELYRSDFEMFDYDYLGHLLPHLNKTQKQ